eukprot:scaffold8844_cov127-Skeletonema_marinoi.AAC.4
MFCLPLFVSAASNATEGKEPALIIMLQRSQIVKLVEGRHIFNLKITLSTSVRYLLGGPTLARPPNFTKITRTTKQTMLNKIMASGGPNFYVTK